jgi:hypothetical protein
MIASVTTERRWLYTRAEKAGVPAGILRSALFKILDDLGFRKRPGNFQRLSHPKAFRNTRKQFVDGFCVDGGEHLLPLGGALREVAHQAEASLPWAAM